MMGGGVEREAEGLDEIGASVRLPDGRVRPMAQTSRAREMAWAARVQAA